MDFELSDDQQALSEGIAAFLEGRVPIDTVRSLIDRGGLDRGLWGELAETGVFSLTLPEEDGGVGLGWADAAIVFERLGAALVPGPLVGTVLAAGVVDGAATGETVVGVVDGDERPTVIEYPDAVDRIVSLTRDGVFVVDAGELDLEPAPIPLDPLMPVAPVERLPMGIRIADVAEAHLWRLRGAVLTSAYQLGLAQGITDLSVAYAKERQQFGRAIGSFQAIKHLCADMVSRVEVARAAVYFAAVTLDDPEVGDPERAVSTARLVADEAASANGRDGVQVHGGMGYTWEVDAHLYLKRAWALETTFGTPDHHAEIMAAVL